MNNHAAKCRSCLRAFSTLRRCFVFFALVCSPALYAQLTVSQSHSIPHAVDGESLPVFFDFSSQLAVTTAVITHTRLSIDFGKAAALFDDPPFYSDIGLVLRKLDPTFSVSSEVTLLEIGGFNDGLVSTFFDGVITFDDNAMTVVNSDPDQPASGVFRPMQSLSLLNGDYSPYWELRLVDAVSDSPLLFHSATLSATIGAATVPEPASIGLAGAFFLGLAVWRRRQLASV